MHCSVDITKRLAFTEMKSRSNCHEGERVCGVKEEDEGEPKILYNNK